MEDKDSAGIVKKRKFGSAGKRPQNSNSLGNKFRWPLLILICMDASTKTSKDIQTD